MPYYEYRCYDCDRPVRLFFSYEEYDLAAPACTHCGGANLRRVIGRIAVGKSEESRLDSMNPDTLLAGLDQDDPRAMGQTMRRMSEEMGEDLGPEFTEVVERLESGQSPESIEESMPDLSDSAGPGIDEF
ncbi:MAG: zinc ribbon domain-containing protein [Chloroflexota bacterium]|nr:MAG: zinc ribbon domain-containing protein [Chloroflexota bacterium]